MDVFDYIIIGAGSAGCVLANRLSADPTNRVLLLEAGGKDSHPLIHIPAGFVKTMNNPRYNWAFESEPEEGTKNRKLPIARGKALGGSSSINGMVMSGARPATMMTGPKWVAVDGHGMMCCLYS
jgi:choline dehydrogenase